MIKVPTPRSTRHALFLLILILVCGSNAAAQIKAIDEDILVLVEEGDNLTSIVRTVMGSAEFWEEVAKRNGLEHPDALKPGQVITFPKDLVQERNFAKIVFSKGLSVVNRYGVDKEEPALKGLKVYLGDIIETGDNGFVSLSFKGESLVNVQPGSRVQIVEFDCFDGEKPCIVNLVSEVGHLNFNVRNVGFTLPARYTIETPHLSAAVRGTELDLDTSELSALGVTEGSVQATSGDLSASVPAGKAALAGAGRSITTLYDLLPQPEYNAYVRVSAEDYISWSPVEQAIGYQYVFAANESLSDVIASNSTIETYVRVLPEVTPLYFAARATDENGIKGFRAIQLIEQYSIASDIEAPELDIELSGNVLRVVNTGDFTAEIHIGDQLELIDELNELIDYAVYDLPASETLELVVENNDDIYISARAVVSSTVVSRYGSLYEFKRNANQTLDR